MQQEYHLTDEETAQIVSELLLMEVKKLATEIEILDSFNRRIKEIRHYHNRLLRSQIQDLLQILDDAERCM